MDLTHTRGLMSGSPTGIVSVATRWLLAISIVAIYLGVTFVVAMGLVAPHLSESAGLGVLVGWVISAWLVARGVKMRLSIA